METQDKIKSLIEIAQKKSTRAQAFYCDDDVFALDMHKVVTRKWLLVDHVSRIPEPGQFFLYAVGMESIIVIRDNEMEINALFNVCRHRGSLICLEKQGQRNRLTCPYHAWTYGLDGSLKAARFMPEDFDPMENGLHTCHIRVYHGFIFLNLSPGGCGRCRSYDLDVGCDNAAG